jgi:hypothetical protein
MFYQWQKALFENAAAALEGQRGTRSTNRQRQANGGDGKQAQAQG